MTGMSGTYGDGTYVFGLGTGYVVRGISNHSGFLVGEGPSRLLSGAANCQGRKFQPAFVVASKSPKFKMGGEADCLKFVKGNRLNITRNEAKKSVVPAGKRG